MIESRCGHSPSSLGWTAASVTAPPSLTRGGLTVGFDARTGAVSRLERDGESWASEARPLFALEYLTYRSA